MKWLREIKSLEFKIKKMIKKMIKKGFSELK